MDRAALPPSWLEELLELLQTRRRLATVVAIGVAVLGLLLAAVAPSILPATAGVGAAVGIASCMLAVAAVVGIDAGDLKVRGARHVRAAGADVAAVLRGTDDPAGAAAAVARLDALGAARVALVPADPSARDEAVAVVNALGEAWARAGRRVLVMDLTRPDDSHAGIVDVVRGTAPLGEAVTFDPELMLARLGAGADLETALVELPGLAPRLPADIERTVVALPPLVDPAARAGATALADVFVLARVDRTSRVDLLATLEALDVGGVDARVLLHRPSDVGAAPVPARSNDAVAAGPTPDGMADADVTGPIPSFASEAPIDRGPRPVPAASERNDHSDRGEATPGSPAANAPEPFAAPDGPVSDDGPATTAAAVRAPLLGLDLIEAEVEAEHAFVPEAALTAELGGAAVAAPARRAPLRSVTHDVPAVAPAPELAEPRRPLRAVTDLTVEAVEPAVSPVTPFGVDAADDAVEDDLATTAVLETLAQEIWSRDNLGGTA